jgi:hypothetical protein
MTPRSSCEERLTNLQYVEVDETGWEKEDVPAFHDPEVSEMIALNSVLEPWDHY